MLHQGRMQVFSVLKNADLSGEVIWVHAASLGEFEQGRPIIEAIKEKAPRTKVVLTFFSPSGYEVRKNYDLADVVCYLPADTSRNAKRFIGAINPSKVYFIKYEFWHHFLKELKKADVPTFGVSMIFRKEQSFFTWYGSWFQKMLTAFRFIYIQDDKSAALLESIGVSNYKVIGDTRFDRVKAIAAMSKDFPLVDRFVNGSSKVIVAGSTWEPDEDILIDYIQNENKDVKLIIAPHEIHEGHIKQIESKLNVLYHKYTSGNILADNCRVLIVDTIGMLSSIYKYGQVAYIGGGFGKGIHNTLEAATYGMPVFFGPKHKKFKEAVDLIEVGGGISISAQSEFKQEIEKLWADNELLASSSKAAFDYVQSMCGATEIIVKETL